MPVITFSTPNIKKAVESIKLGASDYPEKPLSSELLAEIVRKYKKKILNTEHGFDETIGTSNLMQEVFGAVISYIKLTKKLKLN
jgi:DNA-binding NtrC family response regulator